jgi:hypothetical protein
MRIARVTSQPLLDCALDCEIDMMCYALFSCRRVIGPTDYVT